MTVRARRRLLAPSILLALAAATAFAADVRPATPPSDHPILGSWRVDLPGGCFEAYRFLPNGTKLSQSAGERNTSVFTLSARPTLNGFYRWVDEITEANGRPDCGGHTTPLGHVAENYILLDATGRRFLLCDKEDRTTCYAEFYKTDDATI